MHNLPDVEVVWRCCCCSFSVFSFSGDLTINRLTLSVGLRVPEPEPVLKIPVYRYLKNNLHGLYGDNRHRYFGPNNTGILIMKKL